MVRIFVAGRSGQVARALMATGVGSIATLGRPQLDLALPGSAAAAIREAAPQVVVNAAAFTGVDAAETQEAEARHINGIAVGELAASAYAVGAEFIHISTDYVFPGDKQEPYTEEDLVGPLGAYGRSKLLGEEEAVRNHPRAVILRTSWVYHHTGSNFPLTMLRLAKNRPQLGVVADQIGNPTYAPDIADAIVAIAGRLMDGFAPGDRVFHLAGANQITWCDFAREIFKESAKRAGPHAEVEAIPTDAYPTSAIRPANSRLSTDRLTRTFGISIPGWRSALPRFFDALPSGWNG